MITSYSTLQSTVLDWLNRPDLASAVPSLIQTAESKLRRDQRVRQVDGTPGQIPALSSGNPTNWLLAGHPDIYLYAVLTESAPYLKDDERVALWHERLEQALQDLASTRIDPARTLGLGAYAQLQRMIQDWINRPGMEAITPHLIRLAESNLSKDRRVRRLVEEDPFTITEDGDTLPAGARGIESLRIEGPVRYGQLYVVPAGEIPGLRARAGLTGIPRYVAVTTSGPTKALSYAPEPAGVYEARLTYWQGVPALSGDATSNWLLEEHPDVYLYACLCQAGAYLGDDPRLEVWKMKLEEALEMLNEETEWGQYGGPLRVPYNPIG